MMGIDIGETTVNATAGLDLTFNNAMMLQFQLVYRQADDLDITGGHIRLSMPF